MRIRLLVAGLMAFGVTVTGPASSAQADIRPIGLGGVRVGLRADTRQVVTVNHTRGYHARVAFWQWTGARWHRVYAVRDGRIGYGGLARPHRRRQGSGTTPLGTTRLLSAFGRHPRAAAWDLPYRRIRRGDYWVEDNGSAFYNRYRNKADGGFRWWLPASDPNSSERLRDFPVQYEYSVVTSYNRSQVRHRGAGIFLHVNGRGATAGCVSAPRRFLSRMLRELDPAQVPVMAVGR
jgi:L,D-peptidoglycan transpeptidase YkuD (ErfK/YbiS/YcfS/YnhG family)